MAEQLFSAPGYKRDIGEDYGLIRYNRNDETYIRFFLEDQVVEANDIFENEVCMHTLTLGELRAIMQQCEELGWGD